MAKLKLDLQKDHDELKKSGAELSQLRNEKQKLPLEIAKKEAEIKHLKSKNAAR